MAWRMVSGSPADTVRFGCRLGSLLHRGDVVFLQGPLGAGKTRLADGVARGLGAPGARSPSFALLHCYSGRLPVYHADLYRLTEPSQAADLGLEEVAADGVLLVEWPQLAAADFPERLAVAIEFLPEAEEARLLTIEGRGKRYEALARELRERLVDAGV